MIRVTCHYHGRETRTYENVTTIKYFIPFIDDEVVVTGDDLLTHTFPTDSNLQLIGNETNVSVSREGLQGVLVEKTYTL